VLIAAITELHQHVESVRCCSAAGAASAATLRGCGLKAQPWVEDQPLAGLEAWSPTTSAKAGLLRRPGGWLLHRRLRLHDLHR
jgi:hypothetical protein